MLYKMMKILAIGGLTLILASAVSADVVPTNVWTDFYGSASTYNGQPIPVGSVIDAYDPQAVLCGSDTVTIAGKYGFMPVYGDDPTTLTIDEGADLGDVITFTINGRLAVKHGPDSSSWDGMGVQHEVNLSASAIISMALVTPPADQFATPGDTVHYIVAVRNTGQGMDFFTISPVSSNGWIVKPQFGFSYAAPNNVTLISFDLLVPVLIFDDTSDVVSFVVRSGLDTAVSVNGNVTTFVSLTDAPENAATPDDFALKQNYPNPFNPVTVISYNLPQRTDVTLDIYDLLGRKVEHFSLGWQSSGVHTFQFSGVLLSSGIYFYRLNAGDMSAVKKMVLMK